MSIVSSLTGKQETSNYQNLQGNNDFDILVHSQPLGYKDINKLANKQNKINRKDMLQRQLSIPIKILGIIGVIATWWNLEFVKISVNKHRVSRTVAVRMESTHNIVPPIMRTMVRLFEQASNGVENVSNAVSGATGFIWTIVNALRLPFK